MSTFKSQWIMLGTFLYIFSSFLAELTLN